MQNKGVKDINNSPARLFVLGSIFTLGGFAGAVAFLLSLKSTLLPVVIFCVIGAVGVIIIVYGAFRLSKIRKIKALLNNRNAYRTTAKFLYSRFAGGRSSTTSVAGIPISNKTAIFKKIVYNYNDQNGVEHKVKSTLTYSVNQVKFLEKKGQFEIVCDGAVSAIVEKLPDGENIFEY